MTRHRFVSLAALLFSLGALTSVYPRNAEGNPIEGYVTTDDGVRLYYVEQGRGDDTLIVPVAFYLAPHLLKPLAQDRRVIFYDPRNRGRSDAAPLETISLDRALQDLDAVREQLGVDRFALLGWSGLGMEMAVYAIRNPGRVTRLIQMSPVPPAASIMHESGGDTRADDIDSEALAGLDQRFDDGEFAASPEQFCRERNALTDPANFVDKSLVSLVPDVCAFANEWPVNLWPYIGALLGSFGDYDWRPYLNTLETQRLIIHGREDGIPLAGARAWAAGYSNARLVVVSPAGHFPHIEQEDAVTKAIRTFLNGSWPPGAQAIEND